MPVIEPGTCKIKNRVDFQIYLALETSDLKKYMLFVKVVKGHIYIKAIPIS